MPRYSMLISACVLLLAGLIVADPSGPYCGSYSFGLVTGKVDMNDSKHVFDLEFHGLGADVKCENEAYVYNAETGVLAVAGATDTSNCLGSVLKSNGLTLTVTYNSGEDTLKIDLGIASLTASPCGDDDDDDALQ